MPIEDSPTTSEFASALSTIAEAANLSPGEATSFLLNAYRARHDSGRDALVLALIGEVVTSNLRRRSSLAGGGRS